MYKKYQFKRSGEDCIMNIIYYAHGGSNNHGCEAIVRGTTSILGNQNRYILYSMKKNEDYENNLNEIVEIRDDVSDITKNGLSYFLYRLRYKLTRNDMLYYREQHKKMYQECPRDSIAFSIGGDNYCYQGFPERLAEYNLGFNKRGIKTVLWGCSIEPELIGQSAIKADLQRYSLIVARESITFDALKKNGIENVLLCPDPAFALEKDENVFLPEGFGEKGIIGINMSPLVENIAGDIVFQNYCKLIENILENTEYDIMLVPHVIWDDLDDRKSLNMLYHHFKKSNRLLVIENANCCKLKGFIGNCQYFVGARTHSTIAAYSQKIPTLVVGYSVKSKGIAKDLFGTYENYVVSVQDMRNKMDLTNAFRWILDNEFQIRNILNRKIPLYQQELRNIKKKICKEE